jgi:methionyl-tRNA formyltransferase
MRVTLLSDSASWINSYLAELNEILRNAGHSVVWMHNVDDIPEGDIVFYLGCGQIVPLDILERNKHNLVIHASALPEGRGWSPLSWQIIQGKKEIPISLFEAGEKVDSGKIYLKDVMHFTGTELVEELRIILAQTSIRLCREFIDGYPGIIKYGEVQQGIPSYYRRRTSADSRLDPDKTIREQFNNLRVADNNRYPAFFEIQGVKYYLRVTMD